MRKRSSIAFACVAVACLAGIAWLVLQPHEPVYEGKQLSYWLELFPITNQAPVGIGVIDGRGFGTRVRADEALRHMGTNAFPILLQMLRAKDSAWKVKLMELAQKQDFFKVNYLPADIRNNMGFVGFLCLDTSAKAAVPALIAMYDEPGLSENSRYCLICTLLKIHAPPKLLVPMLAKAIREHSYRVRVLASAWIVAFGEDGKLAIPALTKMTEDQNAEVRALGSNTLYRIDPVAAAKAGVK